MSLGRGRRAKGRLGRQVVTKGYLPGPQSFAEQTLRTLCLAYKEVDEDTYEEWRQRHQEASILLQNRAHALHQVYEEMEQNLQVGGAGGGGCPHLPLHTLSPASEPCPCSVCHHPSPSSCWEPQPLRTGSRTVSLKPSNVSSRGTSKCGCSLGTSKVGPRVAAPAWREGRWVGPVHLVCVQPCHPPRPWEGRIGSNGKGRGPWAPALSVQCYAEHLLSVWLPGSTMRWGPHHLCMIDGPAGL